MEYNGNDRKGDENTGHSLVPSNEERSIKAYSPTPDIIRAYPVEDEPVYKATAKVEISLENPKVVNFDQVVEVETRSIEFYETQYLLLKSKALAKQVVEKLNLANHPEYNSDDQTPGIFDRIKSGISGTISSAISGVKNLFIRPTADSGSGDEDTYLRAHNHPCRQFPARGYKLRVARQEAFRRCRQHACRYVYRVAP